MARRITSERDFRLALIRAGAVPIVTTMAGSACVLFPVIASWPALPPFGLLMLLAWRLMRPELWHAWIGLPLGLFDDLVSGQTIGTAVFLWTSILLILDFLDAQLLWRDYWVDWLMAAIAIIATISGGYWLSGLDSGHASLVIAVPQMILSILCFPLTVRLCRVLDKWRLPS
jgi:rod shape-determining protein MreD